MTRYLTDAKSCIRDATVVCLFVLAVLGWSWVMSPELHGVVQ